MPTEKDIEKVARHMCAQYGMDPDGIHTQTATHTTYQWQRYRPQAVDAIIAFRAVASLAEVSPSSPVREDA